MLMLEVVVDEAGGDDVAHGDGRRDDVGSCSHRVDERAGGHGGHDDVGVLILGSEQRISKSKHEAGAVVEGESHGETQGRGGTGHE